MMQNKLNSLCRKGVPLTGPLFQEEIYVLRTANIERHTHKAAKEKKIADTPLFFLIFTPYATKKIAAAALEML
jgi:hypothetical protein